MRKQGGETQSARERGIGQQDLLREVTWLLQWARENALFLLAGSTLFMSIFVGLATGFLQSTCTWIRLAHLEQKLWSYIYDSAGGNDELLVIGGSLLVTAITFWGANIFLIVLDTTGKPGFLLKYKVQQDKNMPVDAERLKHALRVVLFNQFFISIPFILLSYYVGKLLGMNAERELPSVPRLIIDVVVCVLVEEVLFYYSHRTLHHKRLYKLIHKQHHEWTAPIGIISMYAHPIEHILSNSVPVLLGPLLMRSHVVTSWVWLALALLATTITHSGYHFPLLPSSRYHDFHHEKFTNCFGVLGILDYLHGTDTMFRQSETFKSHFTLLSLTPAPQLVREREETKKEKAE